MSYIVFLRVKFCSKMFNRIINGMLWTFFGFLILYRDFEIILLFRCLSKCRGSTYRNVIFY